MWREVSHAFESPRLRTTINCELYKCLSDARFKSETRHAVGLNVVTYTIGISLQSLIQLLASTKLQKDNLSIHY